MDTGASVSLLPFNIEEGRRPEPHSFLSAADGRNISCYGTKDLVVSLCNREHTHRFLYANVTGPILGIDFLRSHNLELDLGNFELFATRSCCSTATTLPTRSTPQFVSSFASVRIQLR